MKKILITALMALAASANAGQVACIYELSGDVSAKKAGAADWAAAYKGLPLAEGDAVRTARGAACDLLLKDGTYIKLDGESETSLDQLTAGKQERSFVFSFLRGKALWMAAKLKRTVSKFEVRTPSAVCAVRGTDFAVAVSSSGEASIGLFEGEVAVSSGTVEKILLPGGQAVAAPGSIALERRLSSLMKAEERRWRRVKARVEDLRKRLAAREDFIDDYVERQQKKLSDFERRRQEKLGKRGAQP